MYVQFNIMGTRFTTSRRALITPTQTYDSHSALCTIKYTHVY